MKALLVKIPRHSLCCQGNQGPFSSIRFSVSSIRHLKVASGGGWKTASLGLERKQQGRQAGRLGAAWGAGRRQRRGRETSTGSQQPCGQLPGQQAAALGEEGSTRERARTRKVPKTTGSGFDQQRKERREEGGSYTFEL